MSINNDLMNTNIKQRVGIIVYLKKLTEYRKLRRFGDVVYFSKNFSYCVLYVDQVELSKVMKEIKELSFVNQVKLSQNDQIDLSSKHTADQIVSLAKQAEEQLSNNKIGKEE